MKIFLDTANIEEIRKGAEYGIVDGVTTNPSLVAKEGRDFKQTIEEITGLIDGPVSAEVTTMDKEEMLSQGREYAKWHKNVVVKLPTTREGISACRILADEGIKINMTLCFSASQALLIAKAGAAYCSPFVGRLDDISEDGLQLIEDIVQIYENYGYETEVLAASLRHPMHVVQCAKIGAHVGTMPFKVLDALYNHPLTDKGLANFTKDWEEAKKVLAEKQGAAGAEKAKQELVGAR
ncbi:MAG: fructose-6-phosphate aldolase [Acidobacteriaceae bacterium]